LDREVVLIEGDAFDSLALLGDRDYREVLFKDFCIGVGEGKSQRFGAAAVGRAATA